MSKNILSTLFLLSLLIVLSTSAWYNYQRTVSEITFKTSFVFSAPAPLKPLKIYLSTSSSASYSIILWKQSDSSAAFQTSATLSGTTTFETNPVNEAGAWRVEVVPDSTRFAFTIDIQQNGVSLGNYAGVASLNRFFVIYHGASETTTITTTVGSGGSISDLTTTLYGPFSSLTYNGGTAQVLTQTAASTA